MVDMRSVQVGDTLVARCGTREEVVVVTRFPRSVSVTYKTESMPFLDLLKPCRTWGYNYDGTMSEGSESHGDIVEIISLKEDDTFTPGRKYRTRNGSQVWTFIGENPHCKGLRKLIFVRESDGTVDHFHIGGFENYDSCESAYDIIPGEVKESRKWADTVDVLADTPFEPPYISLPNEFLYVKRVKVLVEEVL